MTHRFTLHIDINTDRKTFDQFVAFVSKDVKDNQMQYEIVEDPRPTEEELAECTEEELSYYNSKDWCPYTMFIYCYELKVLDILSKLFIKALNGKGPFKCESFPAPSDILAQSLVTGQLELISNPEKCINRIRISSKTKLSNNWAISRRLKRKK